MITVIIWAWVITAAFVNGRVDDSDFTDPDQDIPALEKFSPAPADLPKGPLNG